MKLILPGSLAGTAILALGGVVAAELNFDPQQVIYRNDVHQPEVVLAVDLDGDTDNDILALGGGNLNDRIVWFEHTDGAGTFGPAIEVSAPVDKTSVIVAADLDGDTDLDIAVGSTAFDNKVFWFENTDGQGTFGPRQVITGASNVAALVAVDIDGDTDLDLVYAGSNLIRLLENSDGNGTFAAPRTIGTATGVGHLAAGDLDGDTDNDIVFANTSFFSGVLSWLENTDGAGTFGSAQSIGTPGGITGIHLANFGGDADLDVVYTSFDGGGGGVGVFPNDGNGTFGTEQSAYSGDGGADAVDTADLDGDTDLDLVFVSANDSEARWVAQSGVNGGSFGSSQLITGAAEFSLAVSAADLDGDTDNDVLIGFYPADIAWHPNSGGSFGAANTLTTGFDQFDDVEVADLENDDTPDVLVAASTEGVVHRFRNNGGGAFEAPADLVTGVAGVNNITLHDLNGDTDPDLVTVMADSSVLSWHPGAAGPTFGAEVILDNVNSSPYFAIAANIDGDADPDLVVAYNGENTVATFTNNGAGAFGAYNALPGSITFPQSVAAGDIDGDLDLDLVSASRINGRIYTYTNNGSGVYGAATQIDDLTNGADYLCLCDVDGDMDLDLVGRLNVEIFWIPNTAGSFGAKQTIASTSQVTDLEPVDLDKDGDLDLVSADSNTHEVAWHENDGAGSFTEHVIATTVQQPFFVRSADMDDDGDLDIVVASLGQVSVVWFEQVPPPPASDPLTLWALSFGLSGDDLLPGSDGDRDGVSLLGEFASNLDPTVSDAGLVPETNGTSGTPRIFFDEGGIPPLFVFTRINAVFIRRKDFASVGLSYLVEGSGALAGWSPYTSILSTTSIDPTWERVHIRQNIFPANPDAYYGRLRLGYNPPPP